MKVVHGSKGIMPWIVGSGGVTNGDLCVVSSGKVVRAGNGNSAATIIGIACEDAIENAVAQVDLIGEGTIVTSEYAGSSKTSLTAADYGKIFDTSDGHTINLDDTTGGFALPVGWDNDVDEISFVTVASFRYL